MVKKRVMHSLSVLCLACIIVLIFMIAKKTSVQLDNYMVFGEKIGNNEYEEVFMSQVDEEKIKTSNSTFTSQVESRIFLKMLQENVSKKINGKMIPIQDVIKKSNYISVYVGNIDFIDKIKLNSETKEVTYDLDLLQRQMDITIMNIYHIVEELKSHNEYCKIMVLSSYFPYYDIPFQNASELQQIFNQFNEELKTLCIDSEVTYLDISLLSSTNYFEESTYTINECGLQYIGNILYHCAIVGIC